MLYVDSISIKLEKNSTNPIHEGSAQKLYFQIPSPFEVKMQYMNCGATFRLQQRARLKTLKTYK